VTESVLPRRAGAAAEAPLSVGQERLWFLDRLDPGDVAYNMFVVERLRGPLDVPTLERALNALLARHGSLRTCFPSRQGRPVQLIRPTMEVTFDRVDVPGPAAGQVRRAEEIVAARTNRPFDLTTGPLVRGAVLRLAADDHVLCLELHHIVADGWSIGVLRRELAEVYAAFRAGRPAPLEPLPIQYADYAVWQRERLAGSALAEQLNYWRERLAAAPPLELPTDRPRPPVKTTSGAYLSRLLPGELWSAVEALARAERCTPYLMVLTAYEVLLARYSGQRDFCVGSPVAGRDLLELEPLIGYFVNTIVLRADLSGDPTFRDLLRRSRSTVLAAYAHQDVPFEELMVELDLPRNLNRAPIFETLVNVFTDIPAFSLDGVRTEWFDAGLCRAKFDLTLEIFRRGPDARAGFTYNTDLFDASTITRLGRDLERLLRAVVADPTVRLSTVFRQLSLVPDDVPPHATVEPSTVDGDVLGWIRAQAAARGSAVAIRGESVLTYAELIDRVDRLAAELAACGVRPGSLVAVRLPRSVGAIVTLLACWAAGAGYLPLDPAYPAERLAFMLADSGASLLVTPAGLTPLAPGPGPGGGVAYVVYTSGSTGQPKGVLVDHAALAARVGWMRERYALTPADTVLQFASMSFDTFAEEVFPTLAAGATLVLGPDAGESLPGFLAAGRGDDLTVLDLPTPYWHELVAQLDAVRWPAGLRLLILGADQVDGAAVAAWHRWFGDRVRVLNTYGPTEATIVASAADLIGPGASTVDGERPPIGYPAAGTRLHVLDEWLTEVPVGVAGELCVGGAGVARGYLGRPGMTADRFVPDPFGAPGDRLYRTGDRARLRSDGQFEFLGRLDGQVKLRGYRVELGEVEAVLASHPLVRQAAAAVVGDRLVGYVVGGAAAADLRRHAARVLPEFMVPADYVPLDALPLTPSGKLDRRALPAPVRAERNGYVPPRSPGEELMAEVWAEVLGIQRVGVTDDFFELGGHSLLATRVVARVRELAGVELPLRAFFADHTLAGVAAAMEALLIAEIADLSDDEVATHLAAP
jgi:amino acid adenylation domain-containing protein